MSTRVRPVLAAGRRLALAAIAAVASAALVGCATSEPNVRPTPTESAGSSSQSPSPTASIAATPTSPSTHPFSGRSLWADPASKAARAVPTLAGSDAAVVSRIAATPTGIWLTPESLPTGQVGAAVHDLIATAGTAVPVFVVYGIPARDCTGGHSSGGLDATAYLGWLRSLAGALTGSPVIILEPDALAAASACNLVTERQELLSAAIGILADHASIYVDAGHSDWVDPAQMAQMLSVIGLDRVRGFAVNVSSYGSLADEQAYAEAVRSGLPGSHYVIDTSRNGNGSNGEWCNPTGRALGPLPASVEDGSGLDATLWIKPPGESDGTCGDGPPAGSFWPERAISLAKAAGW